MSWVQELFNTVRKRIGSKSTTISDTTEIKPIVAPKRENIFENCSNDMLVKIFSYQDGKDLVTSSFTCRRFGQIISANNKYLNKKYNCKVRVGCNTDILGRRHVFFKCRSLNGSVKLFTSTDNATFMALKTVRCGSLKESIQYVFRRILRNHDISHFEFYQIKSIYYPNGPLSDVEMEWIVEAFKIETARIFTIHSEVFSEKFVQLAKVTGCQEYSVGRIDLHRHNIQNNRCPTFTYDTPPPLTEILTILQEWSEGARTINHITCNHNNRVFSWDLFLKIFEIKKMPRTEGNRYVISPDEITIGSGKWNESLRIVFTPRGVNGNRYCKLDLIYVKKPF